MIVGMQDVGSLVMCMVGGMTGKITIDCKAVDLQCMKCMVGGFRR